MCLSESTGFRTVVCVFYWTAHLLGCVYTCIYQKRRALVGEYEKSNVGEDVL